MDSDLSPSRYERLMWLFPIAFSLLISHELDAMIREEWRLLPGFGSLSDSGAANLFNLLHVPLFTLIVLGVMSPSPLRRRLTALGVEVFLVGHAIAHTVLSGADDYHFEAPVETITVYGAAGVALLHLATFRPAEITANR